MTGRPPESFDEAYFDKWYRDPRHRVHTRADHLRQVGFALAAAEQFLGRPVRSVLDVGAGEGHWQPLLRGLRPRLRYVGVDPSEHASRRGARRNVRRGSVEALEQLGLPRDFDLVVCVGTLYYLGPEQVRAGLRGLLAHCAGMAFLELFTSADRITGDVPRGTAQTAAWYRRELAAAGWVTLGMHCYAPRRRANQLAELEFLGPHREPG